MFLVFDTETTGKFANWNLQLCKETVDNFPRVTQLSFAVFYEDGTPKVKHNFFIKPDGWTIPNEKFFIDNNMSTERCEELGIPIKDALNEFLKEILNCKYLVAHNIAFDHPVLGAEMIRAGLSSSRKLQKICTMRQSIKFCNLPRMKYPKLEELHRILFKSELENAHDALGDVLTTAKCFFELKKLGVICL